MRNARYWMKHVYVALAAGLVSCCAFGAQVICLLEPAALMLGPEQFEEFSATYVRHLVESFRYSGVNTIYHTCGNTMHVIDKMVGAGSTA